MPQKRLKTFLKIILIIALLTCINYTNGTNRKVTIFEEIVTNLFTLPQRVIVHVKNYVKDDNNLYFSNIETLKNENEKMKQEIKELEQEMLDYEVLAAENELLKQHIKLADLYPNYTVIVADIIMDSRSNWEYTYTINRGSNHGIGPNMAVIAEDGLVGYVESVTSNTAKIVSILDVGNSIKQSKRTHLCVLIELNNNSFFIPLRNNLGD